MGMNSDIPCIVDAKALSVSRTRTHAK